MIVLSKKTTSLLYLLIATLTLPVAWVAALTEGAGSSLLVPGFGIVMLLTATAMLAEAPLISRSVWSVVPALVIGTLFVLWPLGTAIVEGWIDVHPMSFYSALTLASGILALFAVLTRRLPLLLAMTTISALGWIAWQQFFDDYIH